MAKRLHWTQRPENKDRVREMASRAAATRCGTKTPQPPLVAEIRALEKKAQDRLSEIKTQVDALHTERQEILKLFPRLDEAVDLGGALPRAANA